MKLIYIYCEEVKLFMNSCELVSFVTAIACSMKNCYTDEELGLLAAIFSQLGDTLETISAHDALKEKCREECRDQCREEKHPKKHEDCCEPECPDYC